MTATASSLVKSEAVCPMTDINTAALTSLFDDTTGFVSNQFQSHRHGSFSLYIDYNLGSSTSIEMLIQESPKEIKFRDITIVKPSDTNGVSLVRRHTLSIDALTNGIAIGGIELKVEAREGYTIRVLAKATGDISTTPPTLVLSASGGA